MKGGKVLLVASDLYTAYRPNKVYKMIGGVRFYWVAIVGKGFRRKVVGTEFPTQVDAATWFARSSYNKDESVIFEEHSTP